MIGTLYSRQILGEDTMITYPKIIEIMIHSFYLHNIIIKIYRSLTHCHQVIKSCVIIISLNSLIDTVFLTYGYYENIEK